MVVLGIFLNKEMRTGANRRYLELMEQIAEEGVQTYVVMNSLLDYVPQHFNKIELRVPYKRRGFPPASFLFKKAVQKNISLILCEVLGGADLTGCQLPSTVDWVHIHGDMHLKTALFLKKKLEARLFYASRCNDITRIHIMRSHKAYSFKEYAMSFVFEVLNLYREKQIAKHADIVAFQNKRDRDEYVERVHIKKSNMLSYQSVLSRIVIIPGNIGLPRFDPKYKNKNTSTQVHTLIYVGILSASKGLAELLRALRILHDQGYTLKLRVLGKTDNAQDIFDLVKKLELAQWVDFTGFALPFEHLADCNLLVYPTLYDAFPDTILEALHVGCPALASDVGGIKDMLGSDELLFPVGDVEAIAERVAYFVDNNAEYRRIKKHCIERAEAFRFNWADRWIKAMEEK